MGGLLEAMDTQFQAELGVSRSNSKQHFSGWRSLPIPRYPIRTQYASHSRGRRSLELRW